MCGDADSTDGDLQKNLYRDAIGDHSSDLNATIAFSLTPPNGFGHVCTKVCQDVAAAWESPAAEGWIEGVDTLGSSIKTAFSNYKGDVDDAYAEEPENVDVNDPAESWKADWE
ncbi:MAG: hypothetical protein E7Z95_07920 [Actinomyces succiniciruminis]|nr:hypothetical protein [Actinomyces succiniciruminis]